MKTLLAACLALFVAVSAAAEEYEVGVHYDLLPIPVETADPKKIEVVEVFSYGCPHCFSFDPTLTEWRAKQGRDVLFRRVPAMFRQDWVILAQAYYTAETLGVVDKVHTPIFEAIHLKGLDYRNPQMLADVFKQAANVDEAEFTRVLNSFGVRSRTQQADANGRMYQLTGVPTLIVDGRYKVYGGKIGGSNSSMLDVVDFLVAKARAEGKG